MKKKLGVFLIRGGGKEGSKEQEKFVAKLNKILQKEGIDITTIYYEYAEWYGPTQRRQEEILQRLIASREKIKAKGLRRFILFLVSDVVAYTGEPNKVSTAYNDTHALIHESIVKMKAELEEGAPLIIIASSLGTEIISNYITDRQNAPDIDPFGASPFERMETLTGVFMFGNINTIYIPAYDLDEARPFQFPPEKLNTRYKNIAYWGNIYDKNDPLGYPLKPINSHFNKAVTEDIQINSGNWLLSLLISWNAASHLGYWKSRKILKRVAGYLQKVLAASSTS
jgi:hypothetical protein